MSVVVSDFDNTIYNENYLKNIDLIKDFIARKNKFIIATGRNLSSLLKEIDKFNLDIEYYICNDGAVIYDKYKNIVYRMDIDSYIAKNIFEMLKADDNNLEVFIDNTNGYVTNAINANKIVAKPYDNVKAINTLSKITNKYAQVYGYVSKNHINIISTKASKGEALKYLIEFNRYDKNDLYTIGDNINDVSMMKVFLSFAISEAADDVKSQCYMVIDSIEDLLKKL